MRLLVDEHIGKDMVAHLQSQGHDVVAVVDVMKGATDIEVFFYAKKQDRVIVTLDADFGNILRFPLSDHAGILLLRSKNVRPSILIQLIDMGLTHLSEERKKGKLVVVSPSHIRIYPN